MAGGHATARGIDFQAEVAAWFAVHLLAEVSLSELGANIGKPVDVKLEADDPVDDVVVQTADKGFVFVNAKTSVGLTSHVGSALESVFDQFVRQWLVSSTRPLDAVRDRFILAVDANSSAALVRAANGVLQRIADGRTIRPVNDVAKTVAEKRFLSAAETHISRQWFAQTSVTPTVQEIARLLELIRVVGFDFKQGDVTRMVALLRDIVLDRGADADSAWKALVDRCRDFAKNRSGGGMAAFRDTLRHARLSLRQLPEFAPDILVLKNVTRQTLERLRAYSFLPPTPLSDGKTLAIDRACVRALVAQAKSGSLVATGEAGAGKSGALHDAAKELIANGHPVIVLAVDRHPVDTLSALKRDLELSHDLADVLNAWAGEKPGIILIDALDASRGSFSEGVFQELISIILERAPTWHVVASIREFDLCFGVKYRSLFSGSPPDPDFALGIFSDVRHVHIPRFGKNEIDQVNAWSPEIALVFDQGAATLHELLTSPFNLFLLSTIVAGGVSPSELTGIATQVELLDRYWSNRLDFGDRRRIDRERLLMTITNQMIQHHVLSAVVAELPSDGENLEKLLSAGILVPTRSRTQDEVLQIAYAHHRLFDYSVARLSFQGGRDPEMPKRVTDEDSALLLAPGIMLALQMLWEHDGTREEFWSMAIAIAKESVTGFSRTLPARVAAEVISSPNEFQPIIERLKSGHRDRQATLDLLRHIFGVLLADILPKTKIVGPEAASWCAIVQNIAEAALADTVYPLRAAVGKWVEKPELLTSDQKTAINAASRLLLEYCSVPDHYDEASVIAGIQAVTRTIESAPDESKTVLRNLLRQDHVVAYGYRELSWLARAFRPLLNFAPDVLADIYRAAYGTELPSADEKTTLGSSRILTLTSNKRQDFQSARYILGEHVADFVGAAPEHALPALLDSIGAYICSEHNVGNDVTTFKFQDYDSIYQSDLSYIWWHPDQGARSTRSDPLLGGLVDGLVRLSEKGGADAFLTAVDLIARNNHWAAVWAAILRAAVLVPLESARAALPLLLSPIILAAPETRKLSGDLITALHSRLDPAERQALESAVMAVPNDRGREILMACMSRDHLVTPRIRERVQELTDSGEMPENRPPFEIGTSWARGGDDWYYSEAGIDLSTEPNASLIAAARNVDALKVPDRENALAWLSEHWSEVQKLHDLLLAHPEAPERLRYKGWDTLAEAALHAADACTVPANSTLFAKIDEMVRGALQQIDVTDKPDEGRFEKSPSWGRPAPRIEAAEALMALVRANGAATQKEADLIRGLACDRFPEVRHQILIRVNALYVAAPELMWEICEQVFRAESNRGVLNFFLHAFSRIMADRPEWAAQRLLALNNRIPLTSVDGDQFYENIAPLLLNLWFRHDQIAAGEAVASWAADPIRYKAVVLHAVGDLRGAIVVGNVMSPTSRDDIIRRRAIEFFGKVTSACALVFDELARQTSLVEPEQSRLESALRILDMVAREMYFGSGAYGASNKSTPSNSTVITDISIRGRFLREMESTLQTLAGVSYPAVTHHVLETLESCIEADYRLVFQLVVRAMQQGGKYGGYQFESLGADLLVKIIRRYLADYRPWLMGDIEARTSLIQVLDTFAEVGWPEARRLIYELPEMLR